MPGSQPGSSAADEARKTRKGRHRNRQRKSDGRMKSSLASDASGAETSDPRAEGHKHAYKSVVPRKSSFRPIIVPRSNVKSENIEKMKSTLTPAMEEIFRRDNVTVLDYLGSGSYAVVYKIKDRNGRIRAVKVINSSKTLVSDDYRLKFMKRELQILQTVSIYCCER